MATRGVKFVAAMVVAAVTLLHVAASSAVAGAVERQPSVFELVSGKLQNTGLGKEALARRRLSEGTSEITPMGRVSEHSPRSLLARKLKGANVKAAQSVFGKSKLNGRGGKGKRFTKLGGKRKYAKGLKLKGLQAGVSRAVAEGGSFYRLESVVTPAAGVDWRDTGAITHVFDQKDCASCWALATADAIAMMWAIQNGQHNLPHYIEEGDFELYATEMSAQQVGDCALENICAGGFPEWGLSYAALNGGLSDHWTYPYRGIPQGCNQTLSSVASAKVSGWEQVPPGDVDALKKAVATQPVIAFVSATNDFEDYEGGIYAGNCSQKVDHAVVLVGYGTDEESGEEYWIIKNTWGTSWGEVGYMRMAIRADLPGGLCGITSLPALYPVNHPAIVNTCDELFPPICGSGTCKMGTDPYGAPAPHCECPEGFVSRSSATLAPSCVPESSCSSTGNEACGAGICLDLKQGDYTCKCPEGSVLGSTTTGSPACSKVATYTAIPGDTCKTVADKFNISVEVLKGENSALKCANGRLIRSGTILSVGNATYSSAVDADVSCTSWYTVQHGDTCPAIWLNAALTQPEFFQLNPGLQCKASHLRVGQKVCVNSTAIQAQEILGLDAITSIPVYVKEGNTLEYLAVVYGSRCENVTAESICDANNLEDCSALEAGQLLQIPCTAPAKVGRPCYSECPKDVQEYFCGINGMTYKNWCLLKCEAGTAGAYKGVCKICGRSCAKRAGLAPDQYWGPKEGCYDRCPPPRWAGGCWNMFSTCKNICAHSADSYQQDIHPRGNFFTYYYGYGQCMDTCWFRRFKAGGCNKPLPRGPWDV